MHKKLVRSAAIREESPVRSPLRKVASKASSALGHMSRVVESPRSTRDKNVKKTSGSAGKSEETQTDKGKGGEAKSATVVQKKVVKESAQRDGSADKQKIRVEERNAAASRETTRVTKIQVDEVTESDQQKRGKRPAVATPSPADNHDKSPTGVLKKQSCIEVPDLYKLTQIKSDSLPERSAFVHPEIARVRSMGDVPMGQGNFYSGYMERQDSLRAVTVHEEDVPVIVRRRGCTLRVRITSFHEDGEEWIPVEQMILPIHVGCFISSAARNVKTLDTLRDVQCVLSGAFCRDRQRKGGVGSSERVTLLQRSRLRDVLQAAKSVLCLVWLQRFVQASQRLGA